MQNQDVILIHDFANLFASGRGREEIPLSLRAYRWPLSWISVFSPDFSHASLSPLPRLPPAIAPSRRHDVWLNRTCSAPAGQPRRAGVAPEKIPVSGAGAESRPGLRADKKGAQEDGEWMACFVRTLPTGVLALPQVPCTFDTGSRKVAPGAFSLSALFSQDIGCSLLSSVSRESGVRADTHDERMYIFGGWG